MNSSVAKKADSKIRIFPWSAPEQSDIDFEKSLEGRNNEGIIAINRSAQLIYTSENILNAINGMNAANITLDEVRNYDYRLFLQKYLSNRHSLLLETLDTGINYEGVIETIEINESPMYLECSTMLLVDTGGNKAGAILYIRNITAHINGVRQMQQFETMKTVNNFATSMSHHLKNPLTAVIGFLQMIKSQVSPENTVRYCDWALEEVDRISGVLDKISHLAMPSGGHQLIEISALLQAVKRSLQIAAVTMQVQIKIDEAPPQVIIKGHYEQLREAIMCLVHNGMEAMPAGGQLEVKIKYHQETAMVEFRVIDQGIGYHNAKSLFQPFYSTSVDRTGLGLNIAEHVAMIHRGYIRLKPNDTGVGTIASLFLPAAINISDEEAGVGVNQVE